MGATNEKRAGANRAVCRSILPRYAATPMLDSAALFIFLGTGLVILLTPGPAVLYIVARTLDQGRRAGLVSVLGVSTGTLFHIAAATFGLSAILPRSAMPFHTVRPASAPCLPLLGIQQFRHARNEDSLSAPPRET